MFRLFNRIALGALAVSFITACAGRDTANDTNFLLALRAFYSATSSWGNLCKEIPQTYPALEFPYTIEATVNEGGDVPRYLNGLAKAGLVSVRTGVHIIPAQWFVPEQRHQTATYALRPRQNGITKWTGDSGTRYFLCFGKVAPNTVDDFSAPEDYKGRRLSQVHYHVKVSDVAPWARKASVAQMLPELQQTIDATNATQRTAVMVLTNNGWAVDPSGP